MGGVLKLQTAGSSGTASPSARPPPLGHWVLPLLLSSPTLCLALEPRFLCVAVQVYEIFPAGLSPRVLWNSAVIIFFLSKNNKGKKGNNFPEHLASHDL